MTNKEVLEIKKATTAIDGCIYKFAGCYVNTDKKIQMIRPQKLNMLEEDEQHKYFELIKKGLSGKVEKNLINLSFENGDKKNRILDIVKGELKNDQNLQTVFTEIKDSFTYVDNYLILIFYGIYDVPGINLDGSRMDDASDTVYRFSLTMICPVKPTKAGLTYNQPDNSLKNALRQMMVDAPMYSILYPSFTDRTEDIHSVLCYIKKPSEADENLVKEVFGCKMPTAFAEQSEIFAQAMNNVNSLTFEKIKNVCGAIKEHAEECKNEEPEPITGREAGNILQEGGLKDEDISQFTESFQDLAGKDNNITVGNLLKKNDKLEIKSGKTSVSVPMENRDFVEVKNIDGKNCIVIEINEAVTVNGIPVNKYEI